MEPFQLLLGCDRVIKYMLKAALCIDGEGRPHHGVRSVERSGGCEIGLIG